MNVYEDWKRFAALFDGLDSAFGTGKGRWIKRPPRPEDWIDHLQGRGPGIGIAPLRPDNTVTFAAIDLDSPDFDAARDMQDILPGTSWVERSRSGNAHVWVFFREPIEAWVPMGVMRSILTDLDMPQVEVFPKNHDFARVKLGNYINLPYHGSERPILGSSLDVEGTQMPTIDQFIEEAWECRNDPAKWHQRAKFLLITPPEQRGERTEFGTQKTLHICAEHVLSGDAGIIPYGHQNLTMFMLAKCLTNCEQYDSDEALEIMCNVNDDLFDPGLAHSEVRRIHANAERGQYTSTGCDDPVVIPFTHPDCRIAHPRS